MGNGLGFGVINDVDVRPVIPTNVYSETISEVGHADGISGEVVATE